MISSLSLILSRQDWLSTAQKTYVQPMYENTDAKGVNKASPGSFTMRWLQNNSSWLGSNSTFTSEPGTLVTPMWVDKRGKGDARNIWKEFGRKPRGGKIQLH